MSCWQLVIEPLSRLELRWVCCRLEFVLFLFLFAFGRRVVVYVIVGVADPWVPVHHVDQDHVQVHGVLDINPQTLSLDPESQT